MRTLIACLLALALVAPTHAAGLAVAAVETDDGAVVTWAGASGGCVYYVDSDGARYRLGCVASGGRWVDAYDQLMTGDVVEVRRPAPGGTLTGRARVQE